MVLAYADREEHAMGLELTLPGLDHSALVEEVKQTTPLVIFALGSMMYISEEHVRALPFFVLCVSPGIPWHTMAYHGIPCGWQDGFASREEQSKPCHMYFDGEMVGQGASRRRITHVFSLYSVFSLQSRRLSFRVKILLGPYGQILLSRRRSGVRTYVKGYAVGVRDS